MFFHWCEPLWGPPYLYTEIQYALKGVTFFRRAWSIIGGAPWVPALPPGPSPARAVPCGRLGAGSLRWSRPSTAWAAAP